MECEKSALIHTLHLYTIIIAWRGAAARRDRRAVLVLLLASSSHIPSLFHTCISHFTNRRPKKLLHESREKHVFPSFGPVWPGPEMRGLPTQPPTRPYFNLHPMSESLILIGAEGPKCIPKTREKKEIRIHENNLTRRGKIATFVVAARVHRRPRLQRFSGEIGVSRAPVIRHQM